VGEILVTGRQGFIYRLSRRSPIVILSPSSKNGAAGTLKLCLTATPIPTLIVMILVVGLTLGFFLAVFWVLARHLDLWWTSFNLNCGDRLGLPCLVIGLLRAGNTRTLIRLTTRTSAILDFCFESLLKDVVAPTPAPGRLGKGLGWRDIFGRQFFFPYRAAPRKRFLQRVNSTALPKSGARRHVNNLMKMGMETGMELKAPSMEEFRPEKSRRRLTTEGFYPILCQTKTTNGFLSPSSHKSKPLPVALILPRCPEEPHV